MGIWNWIIGEVVSEEFKPVTLDGQMIIAAMQKIVLDIKAGNTATVIEDTKQIALDVAAFATDVEAVVVKMPAKGFASGRIDRSSKVHGAHTNRTGAVGQNNHHK